MNFTNVLLIDTCVTDYNVFVNSVNPTTLPILYSPSTTPSDITKALESFTSIDRIGIVFSHTVLFLGEPFYSNTITTFIIDILKKYNVKHLDFLACDTLKDTLMVYFYDRLQTETGVIVGASDNNTGNIKLGGDWILETTREDIELIYFTKSIEYYKYILGLSSFSMVLKTDGTIWGTGANLNGQLGIGTTVSTETFVNITAFQSDSFKSKTVKSITIGTLHAVILMTDNTLWGAGTSSAVGVVPLGNLFTQIPSFSAAPINAVSCGWYHTVVLTSDNMLWGTGEGSIGQLGEVTTTTISSFVNLTGITGTMKAVACGFRHTVVLTSDNKLWVCGLNGYGSLGTGLNNIVTSFTQINIDTLSGRIPEFISCGYYSTIVSMTDGTLWGAGIKRPIGVINTEFSILEYTQATNDKNYYNGIRKVKQISAGQWHSLVLMTDGTLWGTGDGFNGEFGTYGQSFNSYTQLSLPTTITSILASNTFSILLGSNQTIYVAGNNTNGELGITSNTSYTFESSLTGVAALPDSSYTVSVSSVPTEPVVTPNVGSTICFPAGTLISCDQGWLPIQKLIPGNHTLNGKEIVAITGTYSMDQELVCVEKDAIRKKCPNLQTFISPRHKIYYKGKLKAAYRFVGHQKGFSFVPYQGEKLYNVLLKEAGTMNVQGMICETLHPSNPVAKYYTMEKTKNLMLQ